MINQRQDIGTSRQANPTRQMAPLVGTMSESLTLIVWRNRWIVLATTVLAMIAALIYITKATPIYTSTSRIYVEQSGPKIFTETEEGVMTQSMNYLYTQAELLKSTPILTNVFDKPRIQKMQTFSGVDNRILYMKEMLNVTVGKRDDILSISFDSPYPDEASQVVNEVVNAYITYHATYKKSTTAEVLKILNTEKDKRNKELSEKLKAVTDFKNDNPSLALESKQGNIIIEELERWSTALNEAKLNTIQCKSVYESTKEMIGDPNKLKQFIETQRAKGINIVRGSERTDLNSRVVELQDLLADGFRKMTPDHPAMKALEIQIVNLKSQIADLDKDFAKAQLAVAEQEYLAAKKREDQISKSYEEQSQQVVKLNHQLTRYAQLESDLERIQNDYESIVKRINDLSVTEDVGVLNITILEYALPADRPSEPRKTRCMAMALVMGLMFGSVLGVVRNFMDQKLRSADEISAVLNLPILGVVPSMSRRESVAIRAQKTYLDSRSPWAEAFRTIRTTIFFSAPKDKAKTLLITSPVPGDGKTILASNLGIAMAQAGQRVIIIDAAFRKPMQHKIFGLNHENRGLSSILVNVLKLEDVIHHTKVQGLDLIACGPDIPNPAELLNSNAFAKLLELISNKYDRVVIDSPPVMPVTDARILGALCDVTVLVLRASHSTKKICQQALHELVSVGSNVLGVIINDVRKKHIYNYYSVSSGYYYGGNDRKKRRQITSLTGTRRALERDPKVIN